jgi:hypothetical protein
VVDFQLKYFLVDVFNGEDYPSGSSVQPRTKVNPWICAC